MPRERTTARVTAALPAMLRDLEASYGTANAVVAAADGTLGDPDRAWGLAPPRDYAAILARTIERDFAPRFTAREIQLPAVTSV